MKIPLYGIGVHFDRDPNLFFRLRGADPKELINQASEKVSQNIDNLGDRDEMEDLFGIEIDKATDQIAREVNKNVNKKQKKTPLS